MAVGAASRLACGDRPVLRPWPGRWLTAACLALVLAGAAASGRAQVPGLASIPVERAARPDPPAAGAALPLRLWLQDAPALAALLGVPPSDAVAAAGTRPGSLTLQLLPGAPLQDLSPAGALEPSFIVDFHDPAVAGLSERLRNEHAGPTVDAMAVEAFVARVMQADLRANATLASEVARALRGDCTEYALLTAALARSHGIPARMVYGAALVHADGQWQAYGHAWVQTLEAGRWTLRDSALVGLPGPVYYVPALVITDEGPGHRLAMAQSFQRMPGRIEVLGAAASLQPQANTPRP
jgi:hypothetical protein